MRFTKTSLQDAFLIELEPYEDARGSFARTYCVEEFAAAGVELSYPQHSVALTKKVGTLRGMHFQVDPHSEVKIVHALAGAIFDVIIDVRPQSSTYMKWEGFELSFESNRQLYVPSGFAHGYQTLTNDTIVTYLCSALYAPEASRGYRHDDPAFGISWPLPVAEISDKDKNWPAFQS